MRIIGLEVENFKVLRAVQIEPAAHLVTVGGKNGQGKSSVLDAIWVALAGKAKSPAKPIREGEEQCRIVLILGNGQEPELIVTRTFNAKEGGRFTDTIKVESGDGRQRYNSPQAMLDELLGAIGFDPLEFIQKKPDDQAQMLLGLVPLPIDLDALAREDTADYDNRRDINRDAASLDAQVKAIVVPDDLPEDAPDRAALTTKLAEASDHNIGIERERNARVQERQAISARVQAAESERGNAIDLRERAEQLMRDAAAADERAAAIDTEIEKREAAAAALPDLAEPIDTEAVRRQLQEADAVLAGLDAKARKAALIKQLDAKLAESESLTKAMADREAKRRDVLAKARMPIEGLGFAINEKGKPVVLMGGQPFDQASSAEQIRASTAIAMAANPELRVLRIKDGSLLDDDAMAQIASMAEDEDFQLWVERVGDGGVGIVMEAGAVKGAPAIEREEKPAPKSKARKAESAPGPNVSAEEVAGLMATKSPPKKTEPPSDDKPEGGLL